jgi:hypothetical protein
LPSDFKQFFFQARQFDLKLYFSLENLPFPNYKNYDLLHGLTATELEEKD